MNGWNFCARKPPAVPWHSPERTREIVEEFLATCVWRTCQCGCGKRYRCGPNSPQLYASKDSCEARVMADEIIAKNLRRTGVDLAQLRVFERRVLELVCERKGYTHAQIVQILRREGIVTSRGSEATRDGVISCIVRLKRKGKLG